MTQAHDPQTALHPFGPDMFGLRGMVTPALILLRAELLALVSPTLKPLGASLLRKSASIRLI